MFVKANQNDNLFTDEQAVYSYYTGDPTMEYIQCTLLHEIFLQDLKTGATLSSIIN